ncbi:unnamed protein product [Rhizophagus irregularis]|nr:unnamed protein product [Rhizophagus irregularis]CAB4446782.1 unnamed protein product [Rhizophagus irregularis]
MKGKGKTKGENELPKDVLLGFVSVSREGFRITEKPKDSRSVSRVGFRRTEESRFLVRVGFRRTKTQRFVLSIGWASEERKPKDSYFRSGGLPKNENPKIRNFGWASKKRKPKDS